MHTCTGVGGMRGHVRMHGEVWACAGACAHAGVHTCTGARCMRGPCMHGGVCGACAGACVHERVAGHMRGHMHRSKFTLMKTYKSFDAIVLGFLLPNHWKHWNLSEHTGSN